MRGLVVVCCLTCLALCAATARASISAPAVIDGPSADVVGFDGVAMASDGTGGLVYRKREGGRTHVFAAQFDGRGWRGPQRVDAGQRFDSSWPAIGAGDGGRLVVTWVQEAGPSADRMYSAALDPGARRFQAPVPVDLNIGEATASFPSLAMSRGGTAYLAYLVPQPPTSADPPGRSRGELRVARYGGSLWSTFGFPLNRNPQAPLSLPVEGAGPRVAVDAPGGGLVAWLEPDDEGIDRVWARRLFGAQAGIATLVSPQAWDGRPLRAPADRLALDMAGFGQGAVAFRQQPAEGGPFAGARVMLATIPETSAPEAARFGAARIVDGAAAAPPPPGPPAVAVSRVGDAEVVFSAEQRSLLSAADDRRVAPLERLDDGRTSIPGDPLVDLAASGASVAAWRVRRGSAGGVGIAERRADAVPVSRAIAAPAGGAVSGLGLAGSGLGDALVGWAQGPQQAQQVAAAVVDAPADPFAVQTPLDFVRRAPVRLRWDRPAHAIGGVTFAVTLDDETVAEGLRGTVYDVPGQRIEDGVTVVQVVAEDSGGQETSAYPAQLRVDRRGPAVRVRRYRNGLVEVRVGDGRRGSVSGVAAATVRVSWGDGRKSSGRTRLLHRYRLGGTRRLRVTARDRAGNRTAAVRKVRP